MTIDVEVDQHEQLPGVEQLADDVALDELLAVALRDHSAITAGTHSRLSAVLARKISGASRARVRRVPTIQIVLLDQHFD